MFLILYFLKKYYKILYKFEYNDITSSVKLLFCHIITLFCVIVKKIRTISNGTCVYTIYYYSMVYTLQCTAYSYMLRRTVNFELFFDDVVERLCDPYDCRHFSYYWIPKHAFKCQISYSVELRYKYDFCIIYKQTAFSRCLYGLYQKPFQ